jgi:hypothetical protein
VRKLLLNLCISIILYSIPVSALEHSESDFLFVEATEAVKKKEYRKALRIFEDLANDSEADAQYNLSVLLKSGRGQPQNYQASLKWAWLALLGDIEEAQALVIEIKKIMPEPILRVIRKDVKEYLSERAYKGELNSIFQMGEYFLIVPEEKDYKNAYLWFLIASAFQIEGSLAKRDKVEEEIEGKDILKTQEKALEVFNKISETIQ